MSDYEDDFFEGKRPWSVIKDEVLSSYMPPYLAKVSHLRRPILLIDGFAGPGKFEDGSVGSPLIMCQAAEQCASGNYHAYFINRKPVFHERLTEVLQSRGWHSSATSILGDTTKLLPILPTVLRDQTVFLYLDPFGPTGCPFDLLEPFLKRNTKHSTEIVIMMHMPIAHRLAARRAVEEGRELEPHIQTYHQTMTRIFGGQYWKTIMLSDQLTPEERDHRLIKAYCNRLGEHLPYTGSCPVREGTKDRIKYFIVFASRHPDTMVIMNDVMIKAYHKRMHADAYEGTLFEATDWSNMISTEGLEEAIIDKVNENPGITRKNLWREIVHRHFMRFRQSDFVAAVQRLVDSDVLISPTPRSTKRLNDSCQLHHPHKT